LAIGWERDVIIHPDGLARCGWCGTDALYASYHDEEWGVPEYDGRRLFEKFTLDAFQAGLSWLTILRKREAFRAAFAGFDPREIARWGEDDVARLMKDEGIVRNRLKIEAAITNARAFLDMGGAEAFSAFLWDFVDGRPLQPRPARKEDVPAKTPLAEKMSREMKARGFRFCGPTILYAFMQATGMVNDHLVTCHRHEPVARLGGAGS
jgi:DNA-3-methyladenine glycosylase I